MIPEPQDLKLQTKIPKNVFFMGLVSFFNDYSNEMILSIFPAFFSSVLKSGAASLGFIEGVADGLSNLTKVFSGRLSDKIGHRKMLSLAGYTLSVLTRPFYLISSTATQIFGIRAIDRIGKGFREPPRDSLLSLSTNIAVAGKSFGFHRALDAAGSILGPLTAYFILRALPGSYNTVFLTAFFVGVLALFSFAFIKEAGVLVSEVGISNVFHDFKSQPRDFKKFLGIIFVLSLANLPIALLLLRTEDLGLDMSMIPLFYLFFNVANTLLSYHAGRMADKFGDRPVILSGYLLIALAYLLMIYDHTLTALAFGFVILGVGYAFTDGIQRSYAARLTTAEKRGSAFGFLSAAIGFGVMIAGIGGGFLWQIYGATTSLSVALGLILIALIAFEFTERRRLRARV